MGISANLIPLLVEAVRAHRLGGEVLMLGRQKTEADPHQLSAISAEVHHRPAPRERLRAAAAALSGRGQDS